MNLTSANEHVLEIEQRIRVVKERSRDMRHSLPFHRIPKLMTIHAIINIVKMLKNSDQSRGVPYNETKIYSQRRKPGL